MAESDGTMIGKEWLVLNGKLQVTFYGRERLGILAAFDFDRSLRHFLEERFRTYHAQQSVTQRNEEEIARMTGVEFETYLMRKRPVNTGRADQRPSRHEPIDKLCDGGRQECLRT